VHTIVHPDWPGELNVGRLCVEDLTGDPLNPARQEAELRQQATTQRRRRQVHEAGRARWATQEWRRSVKGNAWTKHKGMHIVVFPARAGAGWKIAIDGVVGRKTYATEWEAQVASYDGAFWVAQARPRAKPATKVKPPETLRPAPPCLVALGLAAGATLDAIKSAFRRLSWSTHPDVGGEARDFVVLRRNYEEAVRLTAPNGKAHW
jgi:hypothetical protein